MPVDKRVLIILTVADITCVNWQNCKTDEAIIWLMTAEISQRVKILLRRKKKKEKHIAEGKQSSNIMQNYF